MPARCIASIQIPAALITMREEGVDFNKSEARRFEQYASVPVFAHCSELWMTMRTFAAPLMIFSVHLIAAPALT